MSRKEIKTLGPGVSLAEWLYLIAAAAVAVAVVLLLGGFLSGCAVSNHGVFPKLVWYWSTDAQVQREIDSHAKAAAKAYREAHPTEGAAK